MKIRLAVLLFLALLTAHASNELQAQVTVGSAVDPAEGALLDVKTQIPDGNNLTSTVGGVVLPRVKLLNINTLQPFIEETDPDILMLKESHVGLTVYNLNNVAPFTQGLYIWEGQKWVKKSGNGLTSFDVSNGLALSGINVKLGGTLSEKTTIDQTTKNMEFTTGTTGLWQVNENDFIIKGNGYVGVGTNMPTTYLDVKGNVNNDGKITALGNTVINSETSIDGSFTYNHNAGTGKYLRASDDLGTAEWVDIETGDGVVVTGVAVGGGNQSVAYNNTPYYSSSQYITLKPGRWLVKMTFLMTAGTTSSNSQKLWIKLGLARRTNPSSSTNHESYTLYRDRVNPASPVYIEGVLDKKFSFTAISGDIVIDTDTGGRFDLVVIKDQLRPDSNPSFNWTSGPMQLNGGASENVILALPLN